MSARWKNVLLGMMAIIIGGLIYVIFRENTFVARNFEQSNFILNLRKWMSFCANNFLKYYFPDFLWEFSLCCGLHAIYKPSTKGSLVCGFVAFFCGVIWELLQCGNVIGGTGDFIDIMMYLLASCICIIINLKERKK